MSVSIELIGRCSYLAAADYQDFFVADLPGEDQGAAALDFGEGFVFCHIAMV